MSLGMHTSWEKTFFVCIFKYLIKFQTLPLFAELIPFFFISKLSDLPIEHNPSDHPRASTIFLSKSQTDGKLFFFVASHFIETW